MNVKDFEKQVLELENFRVVVRAPENAQVEEYRFKYKAADNMRISTFRSRRLVPRIGDHEVAVIHGDGRSAQDNMKLGNLRETWRRD